MLPEVQELHLELRNIRYLLYLEDIKKLAETSYIKYTSKIL